MGTVLLMLVMSSSADAATTLNARSAMGMNLAGIAYYSTELPFINALSEADHWITHSNTAWDTNEEQDLNLDANGWPITLTRIKDPAKRKFDCVGIIFLLGMPNTANGSYPGGRYIALYDGQGTLTYGSDASLVSRSPGRDVINVVPSQNGVDLRIVATDPNHNGQYLRNIQFVRAADEAAAKAGLLFNPDFLKLIRPFRALRFMEWFQINGSKLSAWSDRLLPTYAFFGTEKGVPIEIALQLANAVSADAWLNVPVMADDDYIAHMAMLAHKTLGGNQKAYVEFSNEVWNGAFSQYRYAVAQGQALWPDQPPGNGGIEYNRNWFGMRTAQICDIWKSIWGSDPRLVCVMGAQAAWSFSALEALKCPYWTRGAPCSKHKIGAVAIAAYLGGSVPLTWTSQSDGGLASLFQAFYSGGDARVADDSYVSRIAKMVGKSNDENHKAGFLAQVAAQEGDFMRDVAPFKLPVYAYEGGESFIDASSEALTKLYIAANRDPRMGQAYTAYLTQWKASGGELFMHYNDIGAASKYGTWGALESVMQTTEPRTSAPPKWRAIQNFIESTPCWWQGCQGKVDTDGAAPTQAH